MLLHRLAKVENPTMLLILTAPEQTVDMFLMTRTFEDSELDLTLTFNINIV